MCSSRSTGSTPRCGCSSRSTLTWAGSGRAARRKSRGRPQDLVRPAQVPHFAPQLSELVLLFGGEQVVPLAGVGLGLGLPDPVPQGFVMHAVPRPCGGSWASARLSGTSAPHASGYFLVAGIVRAPLTRPTAVPGTRPQGDWIAEHRGRLEQVRPAWPREVIETAPGAYEWSPNLIQEYGQELGGPRYVRAPPRRHPHIQACREPLQMRSPTASSAGECPSHAPCGGEERATFRSGDLPAVCA